MKSGANYVILANLDIDVSKVDKIIFTLRGEKNTLTKFYPDDVTITDKVCSILLYQEDTQALEGTVLIEAQINYSDGAVSKTDIARLYVQQSLATELVEGNTPTGKDIRDVTFEVVGGVVVAKYVGEIPQEMVDEAVTNYLDEHPLEGITEAEAQALIEAHHDDTKVGVTDSRLTDTRYPKPHNHVKADIVNFAHDHDDRYLTETEVLERLSKKVNDNDSRLSDARTPKTHTHTKSSITDFPTFAKINGQSITNGGNIVIQGGASTWDEVSGKPATFPPSAHNHDDRYYTTTQIDSSLSQKQNELVSGENIKTINGNSILGSGNITIQGGGSGGDDCVNKRDYDESYIDSLEIHEGNFSSSGAFRYASNTFIRIVPIEYPSYLEFSFEADSRVAYLSEWKGFETLKAGATIPNYISSKTSGAKARVVANTKYALISGSGKLTSLKVDDEDYFTKVRNRIDESQITKYDSTNILGLNDTLEFEDLLRQAKAKSGYSPTITNEHSKLCLAQVSDIHNSVEQFHRALEVTDYYKEYINDVINTGDTCRDLFGQIDADMFSTESARKVLNVIGNHDVKKSSGSATEQEAYNSFIAHFIGGSGAVYTENHCYYYKDYTDSNVRLIVVDIMHLTDAQTTWFSNTLDSAKASGLHVLIACHSAPLDVSHYAETSFASLEKKANTSTTSSTLCQMVDAFKTSGGNFIAWIVGHSHSTDFAKIIDYRSQTVIACPTVNYTDSLRSVDENRVYGTKSQDYIRFIVVDTDRNVLKLLSFGNDRDIYLRSAKTLSYNYSTNTIISTT